MPLRLFCLRPPMSPFHLAGHISCQGQYLCLSGVKSTCHHLLSSYSYSPVLPTCPCLCSQCFPSHLHFKPYLAARILPLGLYLSTRSHLHLSLLPSYPFIHTFQPRPSMGSGHTFCFFSELLWHQSTPCTSHTSTGRRQKVCPRLG